MNKTEAGQLFDTMLDSFIVEENPEIAKKIWLLIQETKCVVDLKLNITELKQQFEELPKTPHIEKEPRVARLDRNPLR